MTHHRRPEGGATPTLADNVPGFTTVGEAASRVLEKIAEQRATERQPKREDPADA